MGSSEKELQSAAMKQPSYIGSLTDEKYLETKQYLHQVSAIHLISQFFTHSKWKIHLILYSPQKHPLSQSKDHLCLTSENILLPKWL